MIGIFMGTAGVIVMGLLAVGSHVAVAYFFGAGAPFSFLAQIPTCLLVTAASVVISRRLSSRNNEEVDQALGHLTEIRNRHASLKAQVIAAESEEAVSLQIYALSKALAESLSWKEMAPRLATGIQKIFGSHEFLLYASHSNGARTARRGVRSGGREHWSAGSFASNSQSWSANATESPDIGTAGAPQRLSVRSRPAKPSRWFARPRGFARRAPASG